MSHNRALWLGSVYHTLRGTGLCIVLRARDTDRKSNCPSFTARRYAKRCVCRRRVSVCSVCLSHSKS